MKMNRMLALVVVLMLIGTAALAMPVRMPKGTVTLSCVRDNEAVTISVAEFQLLGMGSDGNYLIYADNGYLDLISVMQTLSSSDVDRIKVAGNILESDFSTLSKGQRDDNVKQFQTSLVSLGYLSGSADGDFGPKTEKAVKDFQASLKMEQTGVADPRLQMLALSMAQPAIVLNSQAEASSESVLSPYDSVAARIGLDMQALSQNGLTFDYDDIEGVGFISDGNKITYNRTAGMREIDQCTLTLRFGLLVRDQADGTTTVDPVVKVSCLCVRRPVIEEVMLKSGEFRGNAQVEDLSATLSGVKTEETGIAVLDAQMVDALANAAEGGEMKIRINGRYNTFDISVDKDKLESLAKIGALAKQLEQ